MTICMYGEEININEPKGLEDIASFLDILPALAGLKSRASRNSRK